MMEMMAQEFPGAFSGYNLSVTESHQRTKADTSGTAKAVVGSLQRLGLDFSEVNLFSNLEHTSQLLGELAEHPSWLHCFWPGCYKSQLRTPGSCNTCLADDTN